MENEYQVDSIKVLSDLQHIRKRPMMYVGETNIPPMALLNEAIDNAFDEAQYNSKSETTISITETDDGFKYSVRDHGRGIPIGDIKLPDGRTMDALEALITTTNSGAKFDSGTYKISCFTEDTKVKLADGRDITFKELIKEFKSGKDNFTYSISKNGVIIDKISNVMITGKTKKLVRITLDNNKVIECTSDHKFMLRDGTYKSAENLTSEDSLMPGYFKRSTKEDSNVVINYDMIYDPISNEYKFCHHLADNYNIVNNLYDYDISKRKIRHHIDINKYNNNPTNIQRVTWTEHHKLHPGVFAMLKDNPDKAREVGQKISKAQKELWSKMPIEERKARMRYASKFISEEGKKRSIESGRQRFIDFNKSEKGRQISSKNGSIYGTENFKNYLESDEGRKVHSERMTQLNKDPEISKKQRSWMYTEEGQLGMKDRMTQRNQNSEYQYKCQLSKCLKAAKSLIEQGLELNKENYQKHKMRLTKNWDWLISQFDSFENLLEAVNNYNHKILKIEKIELDNEIELYDLTMNGNNPNFLLSSGVFVHNCGLHGVGMACICALSKRMHVTTYRNGEAIEFISENGVKQQLNHYSDVNEANGVLTEFIADPDLWSTTEIPLDLIVNRCKIASAMGYRVRLYKNSEEIDVHAESIFDLLPSEDHSIYCQDSIKIKDSNTGEHFVVGFRYTSDTKSKFYGYTNLLPNKYGGTHTRLIQDKICQAWNEKYNDDHVWWNDSILGIRVIVAAFISNVAFSSQTKDKLTVPYKQIEPLGNKFMNNFEKWIDNNKNLSDKLFARFKEYRESMIKLQNQKDIAGKIKIATIDSSGNTRRHQIVDKLMDCTSTKREDTELIICEGDSAAGVIARPRDRKTQAVLPLRGKIQNVAGMSIKDSLKHQTIVNIINSVGCGVGDAADPSKARYERIIIATDADPDGKHIVALVLTALVNLLPTIVKAGMVYVLDPPLYKYEINGKICYTSDFDTIPSNAKNFIRFKGLGAMEDEDFKNTCLNKSNRTLYQITYPDDIDQFNAISGTSWGRSELLKAYGIIKDTDFEEEVDDN